MLCPVRAAENAADITLVYPCRQATAPITIDGKVDAAEWGSAVEVGGFTDSGSDNLAPEQVLMRLCYDQNNLYLAVTCIESNMKGLKTSAATQKDGPFWEDDSIEFFLNPNHDHQSYWQFATTAKAMQYDNCQGDSAWNSNWKAVATQDADSWMVEIALPFADLDLKTPAPGTLWGFNLCRERQAGGKLDLYNWANVQRVFNTVSRFGHLTFVAADWQPSAATVAAAVKDAGGKESRLLVPDGWWRTPTGGTAEHVPFIAMLRNEDRGLPTVMTELTAMYAAKPELPLRTEYQGIQESYAKIRGIIEAGAPLDARNWAHHKQFLNAVQGKLELVYWRVKLAMLNLSME